MPAKRKLPSDSTLEKWLDEGLSHEEIQQRILKETGEEVKLSSISSHLSRVGLTNRLRYDDYIPWGKIAVDHNHAYQLVMLRIGARMSKGLPVRDSDRRRFEAWSDQLRSENAVVHYEYSSPEGFYYCKARPGIDTGLVRIPPPKASGSS